MKKLILFILLSLNIFSENKSPVVHNVFSKEYSKKAILKIIEKYSQYSCDMEKKETKIKGKFFTGYIDDNKNPYGEWKTDNGEYKNCFLNNTVLISFKNKFYTYKNDNIILEEYYEDKYTDIVVHLKNENRRYDLKCDKQKLKCKKINGFIIRKPYYWLTDYPYEILKDESL